MIKLNAELLEELGLGQLPEAEKSALIRQIRESLEGRVGMRLASQMSEAQLAEFEEYVNAKDEQGALKWLESNFPNYRQVVSEEFERLKKEIHQAVPQILASIGSAGADNPAEL